MKYIFKSVFSTGLVLFLATFHTPVNSEMQCKGLQESKCTENKACSWVKAYVTKNGTNVQGYCRVKANKKSSTNSVTH